MTDNAVLWQKQTRESIRARAAANPLLIQPIGAIEQHGPHLPVDTDSCAVTAIAVAAASKAGSERALVLPTISWGLSPYWLSFPGTISLRPETILAVFADIGHSVAAHGYSRMLILNGHGGNAGIIAVAATQMAEHGIRARSMSWWALLDHDLAEFSPRDFGHIGHAGQTETSVQLHLQADLVDPGYAQIRQWADLAPLAEDLRRPSSYAPPLPAVESPNGVYGDVTAATSGIGEAVVAAAVERLAELILVMPPNA